MQGAKWSAVELKNHFPPIKKVGDLVLKELNEFMKKEEHPPKSILKAAGETEIYSRIIIKGHVGMYRRNKLIRVYFPGEICMDTASYFQQLPTEFELRALDQVEHSVLSFKNEKKVLDAFPELSHFSEEMISMVRNADNFWFEFSQQKWSVSLDYLEQRWPTFRSVLKYREIGNLVNKDERTISRHFDQGYKNEKVKSFFQDMVTQISYPFKGERFPDAKELDGKIIAWAHGIHGFLRTDQEVKKFQEKKLSWLSTYLYPEANYETSLWIDKLYAVLFCMDDFTDHLPDGGKSDYWESISKGIQEVLDEKPISVKGLQVLPYLFAFEELWKELSNFEQVDEEYRELLRHEFTIYLKANLWEARNRDNQTRPEIKDYLLQRPIFSGGQIALALIPLGMGEPFSEIKSSWERSLGLRQLAAKMIFITNDLFSYQKEKQNGDFHNWLILLVHFEQKSESAAKDYLIIQHNKTLEIFLNSIQELSKNFNPENDHLLSILKQVKFQISGAVEWSISCSNRYLMELKNEFKTN
jgi:hypothetical protein